MMNAEFREWDFLKMKYYLEAKEEFYRYFCDLRKERDEYSRRYGPYYPKPDLDIVYLEDFTENKEHGYDLLLDFFTPFDYLSFLGTFSNEIIKDEHKWDEFYSKAPKSTFFRINGFKMEDEPEKGAHYYLMNEQSEDRGIVVGGKEHITYKDMQKCCWPSYLTVMYDATVVGPMKVRNFGRNNDYALWLNVSEKTDCYLLPENLAKLRTKWNLLGRFLLTTKLKWRYECYRIEEDLGTAKSIAYTLRNMLYGIWKWMKYVERG